MKLLLDTHLLVWSAWTPKRMSAAARSLINDQGNELFFSAASLWEIAIKQNLEKDDFQLDANFLRRGLLDNDYNELPVTGDHAVAIRSLPPIHKDPFDRILVAQAIFEGFTLLTADPVVARYPGAIKKV
jgi:PIN domain nuclease of toxin-antitoxin system